jgi:hypothetical protein
LDPIYKIHIPGPGGYDWDIFYPTDAASFETIVENSKAIVGCDGCPFLAAEALSPLVASNIMYR